MTFPPSGDDKDALGSASPPDGRDKCAPTDAIRPAEEASNLLKIALPTVVVQLCSLLLWTETASVVGHHGPVRDAVENLAGLALASLSANLACQSIFVGILSASDTLSPQAYGAGNHREVGLLAVRAYASALALVLPLTLVLWCSEAVLIRLGQDPRAARLAAEWVRVYMAALPCNLMLNVVQRFLTSQEVVMPLVYSGLATAAVVHPLNLYVWVDRVDGYIGSAVALALSQTIQVVLLLMYLKWKVPHNAKTWPGLGLGAVREALHIPAVVYFVKLGLGGLLGLTEWWFWEFLCFMAGKFGVVSLSIHTVAYQLMPLLYMLPMGIGIGLSVRVGSIIATDVPRAKALVTGCLAFCILLAAATAAIVYLCCRPIVSLFTSDEDVMQGCLRIWPDVSKFVFLDAVFAANCGIMRALGLQWRLGIVVVLCLWVVAVPVMFHASLTKGGGLESLWKAMPPAYAVLNGVLFACHYFADWNKISAAIRRREGLEGEIDIIVKQTDAISYGAILSEEEVQLIAIS